MRAFSRSLALLAGIILVSGAALAALDKKPVLDGINDTAAVLHNLHKQVFDLEQNLEIVRAARDLTQQQYEAQKKLYENAVQRGEQERAKFYKIRLDQLERQMNKLSAFDLEKIYTQRIEALRAKIQDVQEDIEARMQEYETLFGERPIVNLGFREELERRKGTRKDLGLYLKLD